jgi:protocatechuate 3,4-dioxygenase beta subunit
MPDFAPHDFDDGATGRPVSRRRMLGFLGAGAAAISSACTSNPWWRPRTTTTVPTDPNACVLTPQQTEGPFYAPDALRRSDVREGHPGTSLRLGITATGLRGGCTPLPGATVEIWSADAVGNYSGFDNAVDDPTYMRGVLSADGDGRVEFLTLYPGWYENFGIARAPHIHVKVHVSGRTVHTGQLYFDDTVSDEAFAREPYSSRPDYARRTRNANDTIYAQGGARSLMKPTAEGDGYHAEMRLVVQA